MSGWGDEAELFGPAPTTKADSHPTRVDWRVALGVATPAVVPVAVALTHLRGSVAGLPVWMSALSSVAAGTVGGWATRRMGVCTALVWAAVVTAACLPHLVLTAAPAVLAFLGCAGLLRRKGTR